MECTQGGIELGLSIPKDTEFLDVYVDDDNYVVILDSDTGEILERLILH